MKTKIRPEKIFQFSALILVILLLSASAAEPSSTEPKPFWKLNKDAERWVEKTLRGMSTEEKVGQLIMVRAYAEFQNSQSPAYVDLRDQISKYHLGSVILTVRQDGAFLQRSQPFEAAAAVNQLQKDAKYPLLVAADFERGLAMRFFAAPAFPHAMAFSATPDPIGNEERFAAIVARESRAIGVHWNFFPVTDVNVNPENPIINIRAFGEDPQQIGTMAAAYVRGSHAGGMLATAKHFPGHGDTDQDTHISLARVNAPRERLDQVELVPFKAAIDAGVDSVMIAHVSAPALDPSNTSAGLSRPIVHDLLQQQMGFRGLTVTDALEMQGIASVYGNSPDAQPRITLDAILAGNDLALLPSNVDLAYNALLNAARDGKLSEAELDARVRKILSAKAALGLNKTRTVDLGKLRDVVARPEDVAFAQMVADTSVTLVHNGSQAIPLLRQARNVGTNPPAGAYQNAGGVFALIAVEDMRSDWGRAFERELRSRIPNARVLYVDSRNAGAMMEAVTEATLQAQSVIVAAYAIPISGAKIQTSDGIKGATSIQLDVSGAIQRILQIAPDKTAFVSLGNPYLASRYQPKTYVTTYSNVPTSEAAAVKALLGEIEFKGKLPVTIPGYATRGDGLTISMQ